ncbi:hypothetical protein [Cohnella sp. WQ 127256]|uniref:hypothetical protein n=1 Tax=Cohnella sp. WQ 127256 TaxID=2938790 RepID=UPI00211875C6|nr:hypothetical protein [Cohnella sp. WQ 127256]
MRRFNFTRPLLIIGIALLSRILTTQICILFGATPETAENIGFAAMMIAALLTYSQMNKARNRR